MWLLSSFETTAYIKSNQTHLGYVCFGTFRRVCLDIKIMQRFWRTLGVVSRKIWQLLNIEMAVVLQRKGNKKKKKERGTHKSDGVEKAPAEQMLGTSRFASYEQLDR